MNTVPIPFAYPGSIHVRRHGPFGYLRHEAYRQWLRDEFCFRCVYCLNRELWGRRRGAWDIDHFLPQSVYPDGRLEYDNLVYACCRCNAMKGNRCIPDPSTVAFGLCVSVAEDGTIHALNDQGKRLIRVLRLDDDEHNKWRSKLIKTMRVLTAHPSLLREWMGFPADLFDLRKSKPVGNARPQGCDNCFFVMRDRGELPEIY
jgi:hypothetical protein